MKKIIDAWAWFEYVVEIIQMMINWYYLVVPWPINASCPPFIIFYTGIVVCYYSYLTFNITPRGIVIVVNFSIIEGYIIWFIGTKIISIKYFWWTLIWRSRYYWMWSGIIIKPNNSWSLRQRCISKRYWILISAICSSEFIVIVELLSWIFHTIP